MADLVSPPAWKSLQSRRAAAKVLSRLPRRIRQVFAGGPCRKLHAVSHGSSDISSVMVTPLAEVIAASIGTARLAPGRASTWAHMRGCPAPEDGAEKSAAMEPTLRSGGRPH